MILRGECQVSIMGVPIRTLKPGDTIGLMRYLKLPVVPTVTTIIATTACDFLRIPQHPMDEAEENELYEDELAKWFTSKRTLNGGAILDQYGFETGYGGVLKDRCIEESELFSVCSVG